MEEHNICTDLSRMYDKKFNYISIIMINKKDKSKQIIDNLRYTITKTSDGYNLSLDNDTTLLVTCSNLNKPVVVYTTNKNNILIATSEDIKQTESDESQIYNPSSQIDILFYNNKKKPESLNIDSLPYSLTEGVNTRPALILYDQGYKTIVLNDYSENSQYKSEKMNRLAFRLQQKDRPKDKQVDVVYIHTYSTNYKEGDIDYKSNTFGTLFHYLPVVNTNSIDDYITTKDPKRYGYDNMWAYLYRHIQNMTDTYDNVLERLKLSKESKSRYIAIPVSIDFDRKYKAPGFKRPFRNPGGHQVCFIIDKLEKTIEYFDPNGMDIDGWDATIIIKNMFDDLFKDYKYIIVKDINQSDYIHYFKSYKSGGECWAFAYTYLDLRVNDMLSIEDTVNQLKNKSACGYPKPVMRLIEGGGKMDVHFK